MERERGIPNLSELDTYIQMGLLHRSYGDLIMRPVPKREDRPQRQQKTRQEKWPRIFHYLSNASSLVRLPITDTQQKLRERFGMKVSHSQFSECAWIWTKNLIDRNSDVSINDAEGVETGPAKTCLRSFEKPQLADIIGDVLDDDNEDVLATIIQNYEPKKVARVLGMLTRRVNVHQEEANK
jgi:hypothetical protein